MKEHKDPPFTEAISHSVAGVKGMELIKFSGGCVLHAE